MPNEANPQEDKVFEKNLDISIKNKKNGIFFINTNFTDVLLEYLFQDIQKAII